jgi:hypothetical protein
MKKSKIKAIIREEIRRVLERLDEPELKSELERLGASLVGTARKGKEILVGVEYEGKELGFKIDTQWGEARVFGHFRNGKLGGGTGGLYPVNTKSMIGLAEDLVDLTSKAGTKHVRITEMIRQEIRRALSER